MVRQISEPSTVLKCVGVPIFFSTGCFHPPSRRDRGGALEWSAQRRGDCRAGALDAEGGGEWSDLACWEADATSKVYSSEFRHLKNWDGWKTVLSSCFLFLGNFSRSELLNLGGVRGGPCNLGEEKSSRVAKSCEEFPFSISLTPL